MSRVRKTFLLIVDLLFLVVFAAVALIYFQVSNWSIDVSRLQLFVLGNEIFAKFIFWVSILAILALLIIALVLIFYPKSINNLELKNDKGTLMLNKKAVEGFVQSSLNQTDFVKSPKVSAKMLNKSIKVKVTGDIKRTSNLISQQKEWAKKVEADLKNLLGINQEVGINVKLVNTADSNTNDSKSTNSARVK